MTIGITENAREAVRRSVWEFTTAAGRKLSMSDAILAAFEVAESHHEEMIEVLKSTQS